MFHRRNLSIFISLLLLSSCGQKGALYIPADKPQLEKPHSQDIEVKKLQQQPKKAKAEASPEPDGHMP